MDEDEFCARFKARMLAAVWPRTTFDDGSSMNGSGRKVPKPALTLTLAIGANDEQARHAYRTGGPITGGSARCHDRRHGGMGCERVGGRAFPLCGTGRSPQQTALPLRMQAARESSWHGKRGLPLHGLRAQRQALGSRSCFVLPRSSQ